MATASGELHLKPLPLLLAGLFVVGLLVVPGGQAQGVTYSEGFEALDNFDTPVSDDYTAVTSGTNSFYVSSTVAHSGNKSLFYREVAAASGAGLSWNDFDLCNSESATFWFYFAASQFAVSDIGFTDAITTTGRAHDAFIGVEIVTSNATHGTVLAYLNHGAQVSAALSGVVLLANTWVDITIDEVDCAGAKARYSSTYLNNVVTVDAVGAIAQSLPVFQMSDPTDGGAQYVQGYVDDLDFVANPELPPNFWCSTPSTADFDYDFQEDVDRVTVDPSIEIDPYYRFEGDSGDYGFLGKSNGGTAATPTVGSTHMRSYLRIEALAEGADSNFRSSFTFIRSNGTPTVPIMDKGTGLTAGDDSGQFREHIEARWWEQGNNWDIAIFYVTAAGFPTRTQLGGAFVGDNPNSPTSYVFDVDTVAQTVEVRHFDGTVLLTRDLPSPFDNDEIYGQWFVGYHTDTFIGDEHRLALDEDANTDYSTCVEDVTGLTSFNGEPGRDPDSLGIPDNETADDDETLNIFGVQTDPPEGFTAATFKFLIGIIFMATIAGGFYFINQRPLMAGVGSGVGFMGAFAFGLFPLWAVLFVVLIGAAVLVFRFKGSGA